MKKPVLIGFVKSNKNSRTLHVWCPFCLKFHIHGVPKDSKRLSHRLAHCTLNGDSPFLKGGYYIRPIRKKDAKYFGISKGAHG